MKIVQIRSEEAMKPVQRGQKQFDGEVVGSVNVEKNCIVVEIAYDHRSEMIPLGRRKLIEMETPRLQCN